VPTYDYQCRSCGTTYEVVHSMLEDGPTTCERCGGQLRRVLYPSGIIFKGSGFYKTDSRSGSNAGRAPSSSSTAKDGGSSSDGKPSEKPAEKSAGKPADSGGKDGGSAPKSAD
jgi:putative FmdB family regulatory protein